VAARRPFGSVELLQRVAAEVWDSLAAGDWLEAFSKHPKIGEKRRLSQWSSEEQNGMSSVDRHIEQKLFELNQTYEEKFGHKFIVCATGKTGREMLGLLEQRIHNSAADELRNGAAEQAKIMRLRLDKLVSA
jgi:OHCU decarboxylase